MLFPKLRQDPSSRGQYHRQHHGPAMARGHKSNHLTNIAMTAMVVYGAYRLGSWAWRSLVRDGNNDDGEDVDARKGGTKGDGHDDVDLLYEWIDRCNDGPSSSSSSHSSSRSHHRATLVGRDILEDKGLYHPHAAGSPSSFISDVAMDDDNGGRGMAANDAVNNDDEADDDIGDDDVLDIPLNA
jgi:hypothetical protein